MTLSANFSSFMSILGEFSFFGDGRQRPSSRVSDPHAGGWPSADGGWGARLVSGARHSVSACGPGPPVPPVGFGVPRAVHPFCPHPTPPEAAATLLSASCASCSRGPHGREVTRSFSPPLADHRAIRVCPWCCKWRPFFSLKNLIAFIQQLTNPAGSPSARRRWPGASFFLRAECRSVAILTCSGATVSEGAFRRCQPWTGAAGDGRGPPAGAE